MDWKAYFDSAFSDLFARRRLAVLVLCWLTGLLALFCYRALFAAEICLAAPPPPDFSVLEANETGPFVSWRRSALIEPQGDYKVEFDNLRAENGQIGFFGAASNETVSIDNLRVTFRRPESFDPWSDIRLEAFCDLFAPRRDELSGAGHIGVLSDLQGQALDYSVSVDTTNTTLVEIRNLNWEIRSADRTILKVQCRRAFLQDDAPYVLLQGYATVTTPTARLEANCIKMNARDNCFVVDGPYLLTRHGRTDYGLAGCFDIALRPYQIVSSDGQERHEWALRYPLWSSDGLAVGHASGAP